MAKNKVPKRKEPTKTPAQAAADYIMKIVLFFYVFVMLVINVVAIAITIGACQKPKNPTYTPGIG